MGLELGHTTRGFAARLTVWGFFSRPLFGCSVAACALDDPAQVLLSLDVALTRSAASCLGACGGAAIGATERVWCLARVSARADVRSIRMCSWSHGRVGVDSGYRWHAAVHISSTAWAADDVAAWFDPKI